MAKVLVVTSGKGGVGKTTSTAALGAALAQTGEKVVVIDFDAGLRNLDLAMGRNAASYLTSLMLCRALQSSRKRLFAINDSKICGCFLHPLPGTRMP